jgi:glycosyltransferase involved in cell wall biosynthesis
MTHDDPMPYLSVVFITRNQASTIERLIASTVAETATIDGTEMVLVDSASTDATVDVAAAFPAVRVVRLRRDQRLTAAAGRYVGFHSTSGTLILFLDGDMELCPGWLRAAIQTLERDDTIACATGIVIDVVDSAAPPVPPAPERPHVSELPCRNAGGVGLYRREALQRSGNFNPVLFSDEEPELCLRLRREGYRLVRVEVPAVLHFGDRIRTISGLLARRRRRLFLGYGQVVRTSVGSTLLWRYLRWRGYAVAPTLFFGAGLACGVSSAVRIDPLPVAAWLALFAAIVGADAVRKRSLYLAFYSVVNRAFMVEGLVRGLLLPRIDPDDYLRRLDTISR